MEARLIVGRQDASCVLVKQSQYLYERVVLVVLPDFTNRVHCYREDFLDTNQSTLIKLGCI